MPINKYLRWIGAAILIIVLAVLANRLGGWLETMLAPKLRELDQGVMIGAAIAAIVVYAIFLSVPFVPSAEIGLTMLMMFGSSMVLPVYSATVVGLTIAFIAGRLLPESALQACCRFFGFKRGESFLKRVQNLPPSERIEMMVAAAPSRWVPFLLRNRYLALALAINMPGNTVIGGGGGISLLAGSSRLFSFPLFLVVVLLAVAPIPVAVLAFGGWPF